MRVITIGRDSTCNEIMIADPKTSRTHLQLVVDDNGKVFVVDLNSTNGTFVNGQRITEPTPLQPGDVIRIGNTSLPWLKYVQASPATTHSTSETSIAGEKNSGNSQGGGKNKTTIWLIAVSVVALISLGINLVQLFNNGNNVEPPETTTNDTEHYAPLHLPDSKPDYKSDPKLDSKSDTKSSSKLGQQTDQKPTREPNQSEKEIIDIIKAQKPTRPTLDIKDKETQAIFETLLDDLEKNKDWKDTVFKIYNVKNKDGLRATFTAMNNPNDRQVMIITINSLRVYKKSNGGNGSGSGNNATNGNGASDKTATGGSSDSSVNTKTVNTFKDLVAKMTDKEVKDFCRSTYAKYKISVGMSKTWKYQLLKKYYKADKATQDNLEKDLRVFLGKKLDS